jgi:hypothetical protein
MLKVKIISIIFHNNNNIIIIIIIIYFPKFSNFYTSTSKNCDECKIQFIYNIQSEWFNSCANVNSSRNVKKITNPL